MNKSGIKRHQETLKCKDKRGTASNASTSAGSDEPSQKCKKKPHTNDNYIIVGGRVYLKGESPLEGVWHSDHTPFEVKKHASIENNVPRTVTITTI